MIALDKITCFKKPPSAHSDHGRKNQAEIYQLGSVWPNSPGPRGWQCPEQKAFIQRKGCRVLRNWLASPFQTEIAHCLQSLPFTTFSSHYPRRIDGFSGCFCHRSVLLTSFQRRRLTTSYFSIVTQHKHRTTFVWVVTGVSAFWHVSYAEWNVAIY